MRFLASALFVLLVALSFTSTVSAQTLPGTNELTLTLSPQFPRPYDSVTVTVGSTLINLAASTIKISVNGTVVGENERSATFRMGGPGTKTSIQVTATDSDGPHQAQLTLSPADVALVVEPTSTVPPFYKGAKLVASEGSVRLIALPDFQTSAGVKIPPQNLSYTWKFGDKVLNNESGIGKSVLSAIAPVRYRDARITVTVTSQDRTLVAQATALVSPVDPLIRIYQNDPLRSINFATALSGSFSMANDEETFRAIPYYYAAFPTVAWTLNGSDSDHDPDLTVRTTGTVKGSAVLGVSAQGAGALNNAQTRFTVQFGEARSTGIFGL